MARHTAKSHKIRKVEILVIQILILIKGIIGEREDRYRLHYFLDLNYEEDEVCRSEIRTVTFQVTLSLENV